VWGALLLNSRLCAQHSHHQNLVKSKIVRGGLVDWHLSDVALARRLGRGWSQVKKPASFTIQSTTTFPSRVTTRDKHHDCLAVATRKLINPEANSEMRHAMRCYYTISSTLDWCRPRCWTLKRFFRPPGQHRDPWIYYLWRFLGYQGRSGTGYVTGNGQEWRELSSIALNSRGYRVRYLRGVFSQMRESFGQVLSLYPEK
jgi:hypothetical protein